MMTEDIYSQIQALLKTKVIGKKIIYLKETDSTNTYAKKNFFEDNGTVIIADIQTSGRGRQGRIWKSADTNGLWMSILIKPKISAKLVSGMTLIAGLAVCNALNEFCEGRVSVKWPNDLVLNSKKICGILCEMSAVNDITDYVVCGIGVNINNNAFDNDIKDIATSLFLETGEKFKRAEIAAAILNSFEPLLEKYINFGIESVIAEYRKNCITIGKEVVIGQSNESYNAKAVDITPEGGLIVERNGIQQTVSSGEVSVRGLFGYALFDRNISD